MDAVLGLSVTPSVVGLVLVEGRDGEGARVDGEGFEVRRPDAIQTSERAAAAVLRTEAIAADRGHRVHSIGVTWSDDADAEASLLLKSLSESGFDNIVPVRLSEATDALARRIAQVMGYQTTAVCVIEPEQLIALVVASGEGPAGEAVQTAVNHSVVTEDDLVGWLSAVFAKSDWAPEALVLVGSAEDLDCLQPLLEDALAVPVYSPDEAQLALARGAALACAQSGEFGGWAEDHRAGFTKSATKRAAGIGPAAMLAAGAMTFVASVSAALALQFTPESPSVRETVQVRPATDAARAAAPRPALAGSVPQPAVAPPTTAPVLDPAPPPEFVVPVETVADELPVVEAPPAPVEAPLVEAALPDPGLPAAPPPTDPALLPVGTPPPAVPAPVMVPPVAEERPGILQRIRERLSRNDAPPPPVVPAPAPAPVVPPAPVPVLP